MKGITMFNKLVICIIACVFSFSIASAKEKQAVQRKGETTTVFKVQMDCHKCIEEIEKNIAWENGVTDLECDLKSQTVKVTYKITKTNDENLIKAFKKINKEAQVVNKNECNESHCKQCPSSQK